MFYDIEVRPVICRHIDLLTGRIVLGKVQHDLWARAAESIDRLVIISNDSQIPIINGMINPSINAKNVGSTKIGI